MAKVTVLYWQNIPSLVEATDGDKPRKLQLSQRFQELIDLIAMKKKLGGTDAYLEQWSKGEPEMREGSADVAAVAAAEEIEARYEEIRAAALAGC
jgi:Virulence factor